MRSALTGLLFLIAAGSAAAISSPAPAASAPAWTVDKARSRIGFQSTFGGMAFSGSFAQWQSAITFDPKALSQSKVSVTIEVLSARTGDADRDANLPTMDWFNAKAFPQARFVTTSIVSMGGDKYLAHGLLTLRGVSKPIAFPFTLASDGSAATVTGSLAIDRSQWGVGQGQFAGEDPIPHTVTVQVSILASKK